MAATEAATRPAVRAIDVGVYYGSNKVVEGVSLDIPEHEITAIIGPSGAGKSTLLRCINRMNDLIEIFRMEGEMWFGDFNLYDPGSDPTQIRYKIGMVFQRPNPFPKSIYDNIAFGPRINGFSGNMNDMVEQSLMAAALWDEVKDRLKESALSLSGGQQQRLCIARALAVEPSVVLMDEPCSSLDPIATLAIEELMQELKKTYSIVIVTHNMQQAGRVSDKTAFLMPDEKRVAHLIEFGGHPNAVHQSRRRAHRGIHHGPIWLGTRAAAKRSEVHPKGASNAEIRLRTRSVEPASRPDRDGHPRRASDPTRARGAAESRPRTGAADHRRRRPSGSSSRRP
ncbi:Phosphate import ATP-binding protein PstB 3 [Geodia barretti]|uniref:Phosphate import ATP-binding protein PstB 3 n=1 Tax=Geodia barretti TaxID=519541 RepID=A0AA35WLJ2_GEOBA|nr:Phosphate import ATP-binding protein PstB 3 [Geodia barretti]